MKLFAWLSFLLLAMVTTIACGSAGGITPVNTGSLSLTVQVPAKASSKHHNGSGITPDIILPSGEILNTVNYTLSDGVPADTITGTASIVSNTNQSTFTVDNVNPNANYTVAVTGTTTDGLETCNGLSGTFAVVAKAITDEGVNVFCLTSSNAGDGGLVEITVNGEECPSYQWSNVSAFYADGSPGASDTTILVAATDAVGVTPTLTWTDPGDNIAFDHSYGTGYSGALAMADGPNTWLFQLIFTCGTGNTDPQTLMATLSDANSASNPDCPASDTTGTILFTCP